MQTTGSPGFSTTVWLLKSFILDEESINPAISQPVSDEGDPTPKQGTPSLVTTET